VQPIGRQGDFKGGRNACQPLRRSCRSSCGKSNRERLKERANVSRPLPQRIERGGGGGPQIRVQPFGRRNAQNREKGGAGESAPGTEKRKKELFFRRGSERIGGKGGRDWDHSGSAQQWGVSCEKKIRKGFITAQETTSLWWD